MFSVPESALEFQISNDVLHIGNILLVGDIQLDLVESALPHFRVPLLHANGIVVREVVSLSCDEGVGVHRVCDDQATAVEEPFPNFLA